jgi:hypothetical protein
MSERDNDDNHWHLDKRVPVALIFTLLLQMGAAIWWVSKAEARLTAIEKVTEASPSISDRLITLEAKSEGIAASLLRIEARLQSEDERARQ